MAADTLDLLQAHDFCVSIALKAGSYLREQSAARAGLRGPEAAVELTAEIKMSSVDIVTAADMEVCNQYISALMIESSALFCTFT